MPQVPSEPTTRTCLHASDNDLLDGRFEDPLPVDETFEEEGVQADVFFDSCLYDSIVAAAFGGVKVNLDKDARMNVHPVWLFFCCAPLAFFQLSILMFLSLGQDLQQKVHQHEGSGSRSWDLSGEMLLTMKIMMIFGIQATLLKRIVGALQLLVFVLNPTTWTDIKRPLPNGRRRFGNFMYLTPVVFPFPCIAMLLKAGVAYLVCVDTVSLLLECSDAFEVMNNALAIAFLTDLDIVFWYLFSMIFHLDDFDNFVLKTASHDFVHQQRAQIVFKPIYRWLSCLHRARLGRKVEGFMAFTVALLLYTRQLIVLLFALDTNVLPMARDVCTLWRWETGTHVESNVAASTYKVLTWHVLGIRDRLVEMGHACDDKKFDRMRPEDIMRILSAYPHVCLGGMAVLVSIFIAPQLVYFVTSKLSEIGSGFSVQGDENEEEEETAEDVGLKKQLDNLRADVDMLMERSLRRRSAKLRSNRLPTLLPTRLHTEASDVHAP